MSNRNPAMCLHNDVDTHPSPSDDCGVFYQCNDCGGAFMDPPSVGRFTAENARTAVRAFENANRDPPPVVIVANRQSSLNHIFHEAQEAARDSERVRFPNFIDRTLNNKIFWLGIGVVIGWFVGELGP